MAYAKLATDINTAWQSEGGMRHIPTGRVVRMHPRADAKIGVSDSAHNSGDHANPHDYATGNSQNKPFAAQLARCVEIDPNENNWEIVWSEY